MSRSEGFTHKDVDKVIVGVNQGAYNTTCDPLGKKRRPSSIKEALFSLPYTVAVGLVKGDLFLDDFTEEAIHDKEVLFISDKVTAVVDERIENRYGRILGPAVIQIILKDGRQFTTQVDFVKGHPKNPMSMQEVKNKFLKCIPFSARFFDEERVESLFNVILDLERLDDISEIIKCLT